MKESFSRLRQLEHHVNEPVRLYVNVQADDYPEHWNNAIEVIMPVENGYTVYIGERKHLIAPGEVLIIPPGTVHEIYAPPTGKRYILMIDESEFYAVEGLPAVQHCFYPCVHLQEGAEPLAEVRGYLRRAIAEAEGGDGFSRSVIRLWVELMFVRLGRWLLAKDADGPRPARHRHQQATAMFLDVCTYISRHCHEKLTLEQVAAYSGYSKYHFARIFKAYSGVSFYDFYMRQRMLRCEQLLGDPSLSITEVALRCGFGSIATFNRIFKQYKHVTPSAYRGLMQQGYTREGMPSAKK